MLAVVQIAAYIILPFLHDATFTLVISADTYFCVVDMHAITLPHEPKELLEATRR